MMKLKKKTFKKYQNQINIDKKQKGQNRSNHKSNGTVVFFKVMREFSGDEREKSDKRKNPYWIQNWKPNKIKLNSKGKKSKK